MFELQLACMVQPALLLTESHACSAAGMAGSGKTTLMQRFNNYFHMQKIPNYILNLDPAVLEVPYEPNVDIRDTVRWVTLTRAVCLCLILGCQINGLAHCR